MTISRSASLAIIRSSMRNAAAPPTFRRRTSPRQGRSHRPSPPSSAVLAASSTTTHSRGAFRSRPDGTMTPAFVIGVHFMNPVPVMELVELIRGIATEDKTFET
ncbi:MAG TPA: 3-hydroxyacyl-CoA dehydrogenase NAD-binding domain-containing protein, partial [Sphingomicrobium sp.]|nr:3-hydroxyacyl-CoA dehydrogenase NAD-binding domain-containing protein [Sphingomicrobium sp.]